MFLFGSVFGSFFFFKFCNLINLSNDKNLLNVLLFVASFSRTTPKKNHLKSLICPSIKSYPNAKKTFEQKNFFGSFENKTLFENVSVTVFPINGINNKKKNRKIVFFALFPTPFKKNANKTIVHKELSKCKKHLNKRNFFVSFEYKTLFEK